MKYVVNSFQELKDLIERSDFLVVMIIGTWCPICRMMKPSFEELCDNNNIDYVIVDSSEVRDFMEENKISGVPDIVVHKKGMKDQVYCGYYDEEELEDIIENIRSLK